MQLLQELQTMVIEQEETTNNVYSKVVKYMKSDNSLRNELKDLLHDYSVSGHDVPKYYNLHDFVNSIVGKIVPNSDEQLTYNIVSKLIHSVE